MGSDLATRAPLRMELHPCQADETPHATIRYIPPGQEEVVKPLTSLRELPHVIRQAQDELAGPGSNIVEDEIHLQLWAASAPVSAVIAPRH